MSTRYAVYFSPEDNSPLARFGEIALGRAADGNKTRPSNDGFYDAEVARKLSATPAHYGFHATLKAPFHLMEGKTQSQLLDAVESLAARQSTIVMHSLAPRLLSGFMALSFDNHSQPVALARLAENCVKAFEPFRMALSAEDIARRKPDQLNEIQQNYLHHYGYPFVLSEFRFHMTLTGPLLEEENAEYIEWLCELYAKCVPVPPILNRLAVYSQPDRASAFTRLMEFPFA